MELKTHALDRVLEALSPTLAGELERLVQETSSKLEIDFERRLQNAVNEAQTDARNRLELERQRSVEETREQTRTMVSEELEQRYQRSLDDVIKQLRSEWDAERARLQEQLMQWRSLADAQRQFEGATTQAEILAGFMKLAEPYAASLAVYVNKPDGLGLWKSKGEDTFPEIISEGITDPESYFRTILVRGKAVAAVCASRPTNVEILEHLVSSIERAIEVFGLKLKGQPNSPGPIAGQEETLRSNEEAHRTARLLISEIKLFNEESLKAGRENHDIYQRLQDEIDRGRRTYKQRVPARILAGRDYYHEEVVRILADNDLARLGEGYPGPVHPR